MNLRNVRPGDRIEANVNGVPFTATVESKQKGLVKVKDPEPSWVTWRFLGARKIRGKL